MGHIELVQDVQLRLLESAFVNESCASDLVSILHRLTNDESEFIIAAIRLLQDEADKLKNISREIFSSRYIVPSY